jgi:hypothetical protein
MNRKKGLSIEEKVIKVEEFFRERQEPFTMKELETLIPKAKGVIYQSVQECVTQLVAENRVQTERIGVFQLFWQFSATSSNALGAEAAELSAAVERAEVRRAVGQAALAAREEAAAAVAAEDSGERTTLLEQIHALKVQRAALETRLANVSDCDPVVYRELVRGATAARDLANLWVDNILMLETFSSRRMGMPRAEFRRKFAVPPDMEFIDATATACGIAAPQASHFVVSTRSAGPAAFAPGPLPAPHEYGAATAGDAHTAPRTSRNAPLHRVKPH